MFSFFSAFWIMQATQLLRMQMEMQKSSSKPDSTFANALASPGPSKKRVLSGVLAMKLLCLVILSSVPRATHARFQNSTLLGREAKSAKGAKTTTTTPQPPELQDSDPEEPAGPEEKDAFVEIDYDNGDVSDAWANIYIDHATGKLKGKRPDPEQLRAQERFGRNKTGILLEGNSPLLRQERAARLRSHMQHPQSKNGGGGLSSLLRGVFGRHGGGEEDARAGSRSGSLLRGGRRQDGSRALENGRLSREVKSLFGLGEMTEEEEEVRLALQAEAEALNSQKETQTRASGGTYRME